MRRLAATLLFTAVLLPVAACASAGLAATPISWSTTPADHRGEPGRFAYVCPPNPDGPVGSVWGADTYTDDSSICWAAVHAGAISRAGGRVVIEMREGQNSYRGTDWNGVVSQDWGAWEGSFVVL